MKKKVILVLMDACRGDYITPEKTPFLARLSKKSLYFRSLVPSFGFCERTEILVGQHPLESDCFTAFGYCPELSPYKHFRYLLNILGWLEEKCKSNLLSKFIRRIIWEIFRFKDNTFYPARIPLRHLSDFCLTEDSALNLIEESDLSIYQIAEGVFTDATTSMSSYLAGSDQSRLSSVLDSIDAPFEFYPTYVSILDSVGHKYGPNSLEMVSALKELDNQLSSFYYAIEQSEHDAVVVFCGDHGMSPVVSSIDIQELIENMKKKQHLPKGFVMFLDSTMARFWSNGGKSSDFDLLISKVNALYGEEGFFIKRDEYQKFGIPNTDMYGDLIWICNEGVVISPDYFNANKKVLGMHGYLPLGPQNYGCAIIAGNNINVKTLEDPKPLISIYEELKTYFQ
jgi:predicted AlkP superfamily pyrophosphatase or phosphodiesterase